MKTNAAKAIRYLTLGIVLLGVLALFSAQAQRFGGRGFRRSDLNPERVQEQQEMEKALNPEFQEDVFTFARLRWENGDFFGRGGMQPWNDDSPEADLNLIFRLHDVTSLKVRPGINYIDITTQDLPNYPFVYLAGAGRIVFTDEEVEALRKYLLNGGFLMADDFWGDSQWEHFREQMKRVVPGSEPEELSLDHPIFHTVYNFKKEPQIPSVGTFLRSGVSYDPGDYVDKDHEPHYYALYDDKKRMMALICHNNHYGDGWEHEGDDLSYFDKFSNPMAYPMLLNIIVYAMSH